MPFVAGAAEMTYRHFLMNSVTADAIWVGLCVGAGYAFGNVPIVKENFTLVALGIVAVSLMPMAIEFFRYRYRTSQQRPS
jgi:membrane-associated protein